MGYNFVAANMGLASLFSCCWLPNLVNLTKFRENSSLLRLKVIQGHRSWCQPKAHVRFPISD